jgi:hypothetical protein
LTVPSSEVIGDELISTGIVLPEAWRRSISNDPDDPPTLSQRSTLLIDSRVTTLSMWREHSCSTSSPVIRVAWGLAKTMHPSGSIPRTASFM